MLVELLGLPGSGKSTLVKTLLEKSSDHAINIETLNQRAERVLQHHKTKRGYIRRKRRRGGFLPLSATTRRRPTARRFLRDLKRPCPDASSYSSGGSMVVSRRSCRAIMSDPMKKLRRRCTVTFGATTNNFRSQRCVAGRPCKR